MYPPLCGNALTLCIPVLPCGVPIPQAARIGPDGLGCIRRCVGVAAPCVSSFSHGASLSRSGPGRPGGTRVYLLLCGSGWAHAYLVVPRGVPIHEAAQSGPEGIVV